MTIVPQSFYTIAGGALGVADVVKLGGPPDAMVVLKQSDGVDTFNQSLMSIGRWQDDDEIVVGVFSNITTSLFRSLDDGDTWTDITAFLPSPLQGRWHVFGIQAVGPRHYVILMVGFGKFTRLIDLNGDVVSTLLDWEVTYPATSDPNATAGPAVTADGTVIALGTQSIKYVYTGPPWFETQFPIYPPRVAVGSPGDVCIVGDSAYFIDQHSGQPAFLIRWTGGTFFNEYTFAGGAYTNIAVPGRIMGGDELGAVWMAITEAGVTNIYRRDPDTGITSLHTVNPGGGGFTPFSLTVMNSTDILLCTQWNFVRFDGSVWHNYAQSGLTGNIANYRQGVAFTPTLPTPPRTINVGRNYGDNPGDGWLIEPGSPGDYVINDDQTLRRDRTVQTRCFLRIATRRGSYPLDPTFGSRLHLIQITKDADRQVRDAVFEALEPLIDDGSILDASTEVEAELNIIKARVVVQVPGDIDGNTITVGTFPVGAKT